MAECVAGVKFGFRIDAAKPLFNLTGAPAVRRWAGDEISVTEKG